MAHTPPESALQIQINKWVRTCVPQPHFFTGIDRSKRSAQFSHVREKARGLVSGMADTILVVPALPMIAVELKAPGNLPTQSQVEVGKTIRASGHVWAWCNTVSGYCAILRAAGVPLDDRAEFWAEHYDAVVAGADIRREEAKTGKVSTRRYVAKPSAARVAKTEALRQRVRF